MGTAGLVQNSAQRVAPSYISTTTTPLRDGEDSGPNLPFIRKDSNQCVPSSKRTICLAVREYKSKHQSGDKQTVRGTLEFLSLTLRLLMYFDQQPFNAVFSFMIVTCIL